MHASTLVLCGRPRSGPARRRPRPALDQLAVAAVAPAAAARNCRSGAVRHVPAAHEPRACASAELEEAAEPSPSDLDQTAMPHLEIKPRRLPITDVSRAISIFIRLIGVDDSQAVIKLVTYTVTI